MRRIFPVAAAVAVLALAACGGRSGPEAGDFDPAIDTNLGDVPRTDVLYPDTVPPEAGQEDVAGDVDGQPEAVAGDPGADGGGEDAFEVPGDAPGDTLGDTAGDTAGDTGTPPTLECGGDPLPATEACTVQKGGSAILVRGDFLVPDGILRNGALLIDPTGLIACVGCDCASQAGAAGATVLACGGALVTPGLINGHDHITYTGNTPKGHGTDRYQHRHEWRKGLNGHAKISVPSTSGAEAWGELRNILGGATSMFGSGQAPGLLRNLDRDLMGGIPASEKATYDTFPLDDSGGTMNTSGCNYGDIKTSASIDDVPCYVPHVAEGINEAARNEFRCLSSTANGGQDLVRSNTSFIHGVGLTANEVAEMARDGTALIWSPRSNIDLYGNTAPVTLYRRLGVVIGLGTDWTASGSINMLREMQCARQFGQANLGGALTDRQIVDMATSANAKAFRMDDVVGSLRVGLVADLAVFDARTNRDEAAVVLATPRDVVAVLRGGMPLYGDAAVVEGLPQGSGCETMDVCGRGKRVCAERETGKKLAALKPAGAYDLFFCGTPAGEPSCVPARQGEYDGVPKAGDADGDGIPDAQDKCPDRFDPARPLDGGRQADTDGDGEGDACDPCPLDADTTTCTTTVDPDDPDKDGYKGPLDNCPTVWNDQADDDKDGKGNLCDACPQKANPGTMACPATIYEIQTGVIAPGQKARIENVRVTGIGKKGTVVQGFFVQVGPGDAEYAGPDYSGLYCYHPKGSPMPAVGDRVDVEGTVKDYYGEIELASLGLVTIRSGGNPAPAAVLATAADVATGGARARALEGVLVRVEGVAVTSVSPAPGTADPAPTNEFQVTGGLRVNDFLHLANPFPAVGQEYASISGVLRFANDHSKLEPRGPEDLVAGAPVLPVLSSFGPNPCYLRVGETAQPSPGLEVRLSSAALSDVQVGIDVSDGTKLGGPEGGFVTIPKGAISAPVVLEGLAASTDAVALTAILGTVQLQAGVIVLGASEPSRPVTATPESLALAAGQQGSVVIGVDPPSLDAPTGMTVTATPAGIVEVPATVTVPAGSAEATLTVTGKAAGNATVRVSAGGGWLDVPVTVSAVSGGRLVLAEVFYDHTSDDGGYEWIRLYNGRSVPVDLSSYSIGMGGTKYAFQTPADANGLYALSGTVGPGECFVIGGPNQDDENGQPVYDLVLDFTPDLQNSGTKADGIALFDVPAAQVTATTVPIDAVIYGGANDNQLWDETGRAGEVDVGDASAGSTLLRTSIGTWEVQEAPTPNTCTPIL